MSLKQIKSQDLVGDEKQRFGFRKTTLGLCGAILASSVMILNAGGVNHTVHAATTDDGKAAQADDSADKEVAAQNASQVQPAGTQAGQPAPASQGAKADSGQGSSAGTTNSTPAASQGAAQPGAQAGSVQDPKAKTNDGTGSTTAGSQDKSQGQTGDKTQSGAQGETGSKDQGAQGSAQGSAAGQGSSAQTGSQTGDKSQAGQGAQSGSQTGSDKGQTGSQTGSDKGQTGSQTGTQTGDKGQQGSQSGKQDSNVTKAPISDEHEIGDLTGDPQEVTFEYFDPTADNGKGAIVGSQKLDGRTNETKTILFNLPEHYLLPDEIRDNRAMHSYKFTTVGGDGDPNSPTGPDGVHTISLQVGFGDPKWQAYQTTKNTGLSLGVKVGPNGKWQVDKDGNLIMDDGYDKDASVLRINVTHQIQDQGTDTSTVSRNVTYPDPKSGENKTDKQTVTFTRTKGLDLVTNKPVYGNWDHATQVLPGVTLPPKAGYTAQSIPELTVKPGDTAPDVTAKYNPNSNQVTIHFKDTDPKAPQNVPDKTVTLKTDENADLMPDLPSGYELADGQDPHYKVGTNPTQDVTVNVKHGTEDASNDPSLYNDTHKDIKRTVTIVEPNEKPIVNNQEHMFTRSATRDKVTGNVSYGDWSDGGKFQFDSVKIPSVPGYTPSGSAPAMTVTPDSAPDQTLTVTYKANGQSVTINYTDDSGKVIGTQTIPGKTGDTVKINYQLPDHWVKSGNMALPDSVVLNADPKQNTPITVKVGHKLDKKDDDTRTITRTVEITTPDGKTSTQKQDATFTRATNYDEVLGHDVYGAWDAQTKQLAAINVPDIKGYAKSSDVPAQNVTPDTPSFTLKVTYKAIGQTVTINYKDADGNVVGHQTVTGQTGQTEDINYQLPDKWTGDISKAPKNITFSGDSQPDIDITISHKIDPEKDDVRTVTRTVNITDPDGTKHDPITQTATFKRSAGKDEVTGQDVYGEWDKPSQDFDAVNIPVKSGYAPSVTVPKLTVNPDSKPETIKVTYVAGGQTNSYKFVDDDAKGAQVGSDVQFAGKTGDSVDLNIQVPAHYDVAKDNSVPKSYTFKDKDNEPIVIHLVHHVSDVSKQAGLDTSRTVSRTVQVTNPDGHVTSETEQVVFTRPASKDEVSGDIKYGNWNKDKQTLPEMPIAAIPGYTPATTAPAIDVTPDSKPSTVKVSYTANSQTNSWVFNDLDNKDNAINKDVHSFTGKTGETTKLGDIKLPDGYVLADGSSIPTEYTFKGEGNKQIVINLKHGSSDVTGQVGSDTSREIGRTINITKPDGKTTAITQTVTFTRKGTKDLVTGKITYGDWSNGGKQSLAQLATPKIDGYTADPAVIAALEVTPDSKPMTTVDVHYSADEAGQTIVYQDKDGNEVGTQRITGKTGETVNVTPQPPKGWVIDPDSASKLPTSVVIPAKDNNPIKVGVKHQIITLRPGEASEEYGVKDSDVNKTVTRTITVNTPTDVNAPIAPSANVDASTPNAVPADGQANKPVQGNGNTIVQSVKFMRAASIDAVTGKITYSDWQANGNDTFAAYKAPEVKGYVAVPSEVAAEKATPDMKDQTVTINYILAKDAGTQTIIYQDKDGKQVGKQDITGKLDTDVPVTPQPPKGWTIDPDSKVKLPATVHITKDNKPITISVTHKLDLLDPENPGHGLSADDFKRDVTRPIIITLPGGSDVDMSQTVHFIRGGSYDEVTGDIVFTPWKGDKKQMPEMVLPPINGKLPTPNVIPAADVTIDSKFAPIHVLYDQNTGANGNGSSNGSNSGSIGGGSRIGGGVVDNNANNGATNGINNGMGQQPTDTNTNKNNATESVKKAEKDSEKAFERGYNKGFKAGWKARGEHAKYGRYYNVSGGYGYNGQAGAVYGNGYAAGYGAGYYGDAGAGYSYIGGGYAGAASEGVQYVAEGSNGFYGYGSGMYAGGEGAGAMNGGYAMLPQTGHTKMNALAAAALALVAGAGILGLAASKKRKEE